ncbi:hypothetical protein CO611_09005 [Lysobacteraceae bacterium NML03-0222]|nr:hypothetical protein CO611_09005 [Xanthomonadaceae bacterium NML03-0222]
MYFFEREGWKIRTESPAQRAEREANTRKELGDKAYRQLTEPALPDEDKKWGVHNRVEVTPVDAHALYRFNDTFIDVRGAPLEEKRGLMTFLFLVFGVGLGGGMADLAIEAVNRDFFVDAEIAKVSDKLAVLLMCVVVVGYLFFIYKFLLPFARTEIFTQRHIIVRFNRKTRQVYIHRPKFAGGLVVMPWEHTYAGINPDLPDASVIGESLIVAWPAELSGAGYDESAFLGEPMDGNLQVMGLWEYIRRYMEEGPDAVPKPKRLRPLFPWPWASIRAVLNFMAPVWRRGGQAYALLFGLVLSPLMLLHAVCHWLSLLLCWPVRWPKEIAQAGQPGKPVPKLTVAEDFGEPIASYLRANTLADQKQLERLQRRAARRLARRQQREAAKAAAAEQDTEH